MNEVNINKNYRFAISKDYWALLFKDKFVFKRLYIFIYLKERKKAFVLWFTPEMPTVAQMGLGQSGSLPRVWQTLSYLNHHLLVLACGLAGCWIRRVTDGN